MRLLVVEDDDRVAAALCSVLHQHGFTVLWARNAALALDLMAKEPDLVLLDLGLPDGDGFDVVQRIRLTSSVPIIVVTSRSDLTARVHGLYLGADDVLVKPYNVRELVARIHAVARRTASSTTVGESPGPGVVVAAPSAPDRPDRPEPRVQRLDVGDLRIDVPARRVTVRGREIALTRKEFDLLLTLARSAGVVLRREQLISAVWGSTLRSTARTLEVHVASLRGKLGQPWLVHTVRGVGYRLALPDPPEPPTARAQTGG